MLYPYYVLLTSTTAGTSPLPRAWNTQQSVYTDQNHSHHVHDVQEGPGIQHLVLDCIPELEDRVVLPANNEARICIYGYAMFLLLLLPFAVRLHCAHCLV